MKKIILPFLIFLLFAPIASAGDRTDFDTLKLLIQELQEDDYITAKQYVSSNSQSLVDRYSKYSLGALTPKEVVLLSEVASSRYRYLKISGSNKMDQTARAMIVAFVTEGDNPKIDVPETMRLGFGPNWQKKLNMMEQTYNFSRQNLGEQQSLEILNAMLSK